jgi:hypothetical protein
MSQPIRTTKDGPWLWISRQSVRAICGLGHRASSTMSVYVALCEIASERKASVFVEPRHSIALRSGVCCRTVGYALTRLVNLGLIERDRGPEQVGRFALTRHVDFLPSTRSTSLPHLEQAGAPPGALNAPPGALNALVDSRAKLEGEPATRPQKEAERTQKGGAKGESHDIDVAGKKAEKLPLSGIPSAVVVGLEDVLRYARDQGIQENVARQFFDNFEAKGWHTANGHPVVSWKARLRAWAAEAPSHRKKVREPQRPIELKILSKKAKP